MIGTINGKHYEVLKNPRPEMLGLVAKNNKIKFSADPETKTIYFFSPENLHKHYFKNIIKKPFEYTKHIHGEAQKIGRNQWIVNTANNLKKYKEDIEQGVVGATKKWRNFIKQDFSFIEKYILFKPFLKGLEKDIDDMEEKQKKNKEKSEISSGKNIKLSKTRAEKALKNFKKEVLDVKKSDWYKN